MAEDVFDDEDIFTQVATEGLSFCGWMRQRREKDRDGNIVSNKKR